MKTTTKRAKPRIGSLPITLAILIVCTALSANAGTLASVYLQFFIEYAQTGPSTAVLSDHVLYVVAYPGIASEFANGELVSCGNGTGCPQALSPFLDGSFWLYSDAADLSTFDTEFPLGDYTVTLSDPGSASSTVDYSQNLFPADIPMLTAATYEALQGLNTASGFAINFNAFSPNSSAQWAVTSLEIHDSMGAAELFQSYDPATTSVFIPANMFLPNSTYTWQLRFSEGTATYDSGNVYDSQSFTVSNWGTFTTGASTPEPGTVALMSLGLALCAFRVKRLGR